jgi:hypothetical protein
VNSAPAVDHNCLVNDERPRGPLDRLVGAFPLDAVIRQIDIQALLERIDLNALLDQVDVERLLARVDLNELIAQIDFEQVLAKSTKGVAARTVDAIRVTAGRLDLTVEAGVDRLLRRNRTEFGPPAALDPAPSP